MPKRIKKKKNNIFSTLSNMKNMVFKYSHILVWCLAILFVTSSINHYLADDDEGDVQEYNLKKIKESKLDEIFSQKNMEHHQIKLWVLNNTTGLYGVGEKGLAARIMACLIEGYQSENGFVRGDYDVRMAENFSDYSDQLGLLEQTSTYILVHIDTSQVIDFDKHIENILTFTGYELSNKPDRVRYTYTQKNNHHLFRERDITLVLGDDWDKGKLNNCHSK